MSNPKTFRFISHKDISKQLQSIELYPGLKLIDIFTIRHQTLGSYLYESEFHTMGAADYKKKLEELLNHHGINIVMLPVRKSDNLFLFNNIIHQPEIKIEHKTKIKEEEKND